MSAWVRALQAEWLKTRRSLAPWLVLGAGCFTPAIIAVARVARAPGLAQSTRAPDFWDALWRQTWESVGVVLLPLFLVVLVALVLHLEGKDDAWKLVYVAPQRHAVLFFAKLVLILFLASQFLLVVDLAMVASAWLPSLLRSELPFPEAPFPWATVAWRTGRYLAAGLPVVAGQYALGLCTRNVLLPVGVGLGGWLGSIGLASWSGAWVLPYGHSALEFLVSSGHRAAGSLPLSPPLLGVLAFLGLTAVGFVLGARVRRGGLGW